MFVFIGKLQIFNYHNKKGNSIQVGWVGNLNISSHRWATIGMFDRYLGAIDMSDIHLGDIRHV